MRVKICGISLALAVTLLGSAHAASPAKPESLRARVASLFGFGGKARATPSPANERVSWGPYAVPDTVRIHGRAIPRAVYESMFPEVFGPRPSTGAHEQSMRIGNRVVTKSQWENAWEKAFSEELAQRNMR